MNEASRASGAAKRPREAGFVRDAVVSLLAKRGVARVAEIHAGLLEEHESMSASSVRSTLSLNTRVFRRVSHGRYCLRHPQPVPARGAFNKNEQA